jgi:TetR/AcrR family transcriptional regulator, transcriptional repressor for nem operon
MSRKASATRQRILDAAQANVMERGFASTSVDAIQEAAGISRGTFFYHFPSKDDLARELILRHAETDRAITDEFMARAERLSSDPLQQVLLFIGFHEELFAEATMADPGCLFASFSYEAGLFDEETHAIIEDSIEHFRTVLATRLEAAMKRHPPKVAADPVALADFVYGVMQGGFILSRANGDLGAMCDHIRQLRTYFELLFGVAEERPAPGATET